MHLGPGLIGHTITPGGRRQADAQLAQPPGEAGVFDRQAMLFLEFFKDALHVSVALLVELAQKVRVDGGGGGTCGHLSLLGDDSAHGIAADRESPGYHSAVN